MKKYLLKADMHLFFNNIHKKNLEAVAYSGAINKAVKKEWVNQILGQNISMHSSEHN